MTNDDALVLQPIGVIRSPYAQVAGTPIQPTYADEALGQLIIEPTLEAALDDIEGFERIWLLYHFDRAAPFAPHVVPFRDTRGHGLFATRAPSRPNPLGLSVVRLLARHGNVLEISGVDVLDETPLFDLKPYVPAFDAYPDSRAGWLDAARAERQVADGRFDIP